LNSSSLKLKIVAYTLPIVKVQKHKSEKKRYKYNESIHKSKKKKSRRNLPTSKKIFWHASKKQKIYLQTNGKIFFTTKKTKIDTNQKLFFDFGGAFCFWLSFNRKNEKNRFELDKQNLKGKKKKTAIIFVAGRLSSFRFKSLAFV